MKKLISFVFAGILAFTGCMSVGQKQNCLKKKCCRITKINYHGWKDCYEMSNGMIKIVVVPGIGGRIMNYSLDGTNVLYENPAETGKIYPLEEGIWRNFGGYKVWPAPQTWWPPDPVLDAGMNNVRILGPSSLRITGTASRNSGLQYVKDVSIYPESSRVTVAQTMVNTGDEAIERSIWDVTQVAVPGCVFFPVNPGSIFPGGVKYWDAEKILSGDITLKNDVVLARYSGKQGKAGADSAKGWIAYLYGDTVYLKTFPYFPCAKYPDGGCTVEVWANTSPPYVEVEVLSPLKTLEPGQSYTFTEEWYLYKLSGVAKNDDETVNEIKSLVGKSRGGDVKMRTVYTPDFRINWKSEDVLEVYDGKDERIAWMGKDDMYLHEAKTVLPDKTSSQRGCDIPLFCWFQYLPGFAARRLEGIAVMDDGPEQVRIRLDGISEDGAVSCRTELSIGVDHYLRSYTYDVKMDIEVLKDGSANYIGGRKGAVEFVNFYPLGVASHRKKLWQQTVYRTHDGSYLGIPHNHIPSSDKYNIRVPVNGIIGFFNEQEGNPVIEVAQDTEVNVCWMWYDNHLCLPVTASDDSGRILPGTKMRAEYRLLHYSSSCSQEILGKVKRRLVSEEEKSGLLFPAYREYGNSFEEAVVPGTEDCSSFWARGTGRFDRGISIGFSETGISNQLNGTGDAVLEWIDGIARSGKKSLRIITKKSMPCAWALISGGWPNEGVVWGQEILPGRRYLFSGYARTENLKGEGAYLACVMRDKYSNLIENGCFSSPEKLSGDNGWTKVEVLIPEVPPEAVMIDLVLQHNGQGTSWFDDVRFEVQKK